jgi:hypothetical protein
VSIIPHFTPLVKPKSKGNMTHFLPPTVQKPSDFKKLAKDAQEPYNLRYKSVTTAPKTPNDSQERDSFESPNYAVDILVPFIPKGITHIWEPAAGGLKISHRLKYHNYDVWSSDIRFSLESYDNTYGNFVGNYLPTWWKYEFNRDSFAIVTNPPFSIKDLFIEKAFEYRVPFAFLINADYSGKTIDWIERGCEKIVPKQRIAFITPRIIQRVNDGEGSDYKTKEEIPSHLIYKYSAAQFHSMWLCYKFNLGKTETFVDIPIDIRKNNI